MRKFSELGVTVQDERKMFNCSQVSISDVLNCEIIVEDFIPDVKTSHGEGRYLVKFINIAMVRMVSFSQTQLL